MSFTIDLDGPFFKRDVRRTVRQNIRDLMEKTAEAGEQEVKARIAAIPPKGVRSGRVHESYRGRTVSVRPPGRKWALNAVVSPSVQGLNASQAISLMAAASRVEGKHHPVSRAFRTLRFAWRSVDLTKGLD